MPASMKSFGRGTQVEFPSTEAKVCRGLVALLVLASAAAHSQDPIYTNGFEFFAADASGSYDISIESVVDPCEQRQFTGDPPPTIAVARLARESYGVTGDSPWVTLAGSIDEDGTGAASLSGSGTVAGFSNVLCTFQGTVLGGVMEGTVTWGAGNELPSCGSPEGSSIQFNIVGVRN